MKFSVRTESGSIYEANGTNIVPVQIGTRLTGWAVNGFWYDAKNPITIEVEPYAVIDFESIRRAFKDGAPKVPPKAAPHFVVSPPPCVA